MKAIKYHIIGGGIAGLSAAKYIRLHNKNAFICMYEAGGKLGGRCQSYYDKKLGAKVDNATHVIIKANKEALKLAGEVKFNRSMAFYDLAKATISKKIFKHKEELALAAFNLPLSQVAKAIFKKVFWKTFPFVHLKKIYFSDNHLSESLINPQIQYIDELNFGHVLRDVASKDSKITQLIFNNKSVDVKDDEKVIIALDAHNFSRIFKSADFIFSQIINIHYRTSTPITLPDLRSYMGVKNGLAQWIFVNGDILSATISNTEQIQFSKQKLAAKIWQEICQIRGVEAAFVPPYTILKYARATILQDEDNNNLRPTTCKMEYKNLFIAGDWTMKNWPCSIEAAAISGKRAAKAATKKWSKFFPK